MFADSLLLASGAISATGTVTGQSIAGSGYLLSTNTVDLSQNRSIGEGQDLYIRAQVITGVTGGASVEIQAIQADDEALSWNVTVIGSTGIIPAAQLSAGARFAANINPRLMSRGQRYLGLRYIVNGWAYTGSIFADFGLGVPDGAKYYPSSYTVL